MSKPLAIRATFADMKIVKTRQVVQLILELPLADFDQAYEVLGGLPNPANERWFAIAAIKEVVPDNQPTQTRSTTDAWPEPKQDKPARAKHGIRPWRDLLPSSQAAIRCEEAAFTHFLREARPDDWHETQDTADCVRLICGVASRGELNSNHAARVIWHQLDAHYDSWKLLERIS